MFRDQVVNLLSAVVVFLLLTNAFCWMLLWAVIKGADMSGAQFVPIRIRAKRDDPNSNA